MDSHDWVFDVLADLKTYAEAQGFNELAQQAEHTLEVARREIAAARRAAPRPPDDPVQ